MSRIVVTLPLRTVSEANRRDHWRVKAKRAQEQRSVTRMAVLPRTRNLIPAIDWTLCTVLLVRTGPRFLDGDNLCGALKGVRDGVADALGVQDNDPRVTWAYGQDRGPAGVRISISGGAS